jgi:hypothetical protein
MQFGLLDFAQGSQDRFWGYGFGHDLPLLNVIATYFFDDLISKNNLALAAVLRDIVPAG